MRVRAAYVGTRYDGGRAEMKVSDLANTLVMYDSDNDVYIQETDIMDKSRVAFSGICTMYRTTGSFASPTTVVNPSPGISSVANWSPSISMSPNLSSGMVTTSSMGGTSEAIPIDDITAVPINKKAIM